MRRRKPRAATRCAASERELADVRAASTSRHKGYELERSRVLRALAAERWGKLAAVLQARAARLDAELQLASRTRKPADLPITVEEAAAAAHTDWVPVIDVFTSAKLSPSEENLMRRVIASRVAPAPSITYTRRPL